MITHPHCCGIDLKEQIGLCVCVIVENIVCFPWQRIYSLELEGVLILADRIEGANGGRYTLELKVRNSQNNLASLE